MPELLLSSLGWDDSWAEVLTPYPDAIPGRMARVDRGHGIVLTEHGAIRAAWQGEPPCTGDWVALSAVPGGHEVTAILPRRTSLVRGGVARASRDGLSGDSRGHVLAANVDTVLVVEPAVPANLSRIERMLALAWQSGARPYVVITKIDLAEYPSTVLEGVASAAPGVDVQAVSALTGEGMDVLPALAAGTSVLLGISRAGKSTLVNALAGEEVMRTQQIRTADGRGRHTTTHRELVVTSGGLIIDTPGIRRIGLYDAEEGLAQAYADLEEFAADCRFSDCVHQTEPGCAVRAAVDSGDLPERRLIGWRKLRREADWMASRTDARLRAERVRTWKIMHREARRRRNGA